MGREELKVDNNGISRVLRSETRTMTPGSLVSRCLVQSENKTTSHHQTVVLVPRTRPVCSFVYSLEKKKEKKTCVKFKLI